MPMPGQKGTSDSSTIASKSGTSDSSTIASKSGRGSFEEQPNIIQPTLFAINSDLQAVKESQAELKRQLGEWMRKHGDVLSEVKLQHQQLQTMIKDAKVSRPSRAHTGSRASANPVAVKNPLNPSQCSTTKEDVPAASVGNGVEVVSDSQSTSELRSNADPDSERAQLTIGGFGFSPSTDADEKPAMVRSSSYSPYGRTASQVDDTHYRAQLERLQSMKANIKRQKRVSKKMEQHSWKRYEDIHLCRKVAKHCVESITFDVCFGCLIIANAALIGAEVEYNTEHDESIAFFVVAQYFFCIMFILEFAIRITAAGFRDHFFGHEWIWSWFDLAMICVSLVEVIDSLSAGRKDGDDMGSQMLRIVRMARLARIVRVLRFSPQLMVMVFMILESAKALIYALVLIAIILYVFSICFTMGATDYLNNSEGVRQYTEDVQEHYGSIFRSIYSLFKSVTNGQSWGELLLPVFDMGVFYVSIFLFWISFAVLAVLNIVTGFFVDGALQKSALERDLMAEKELSRKRTVVATLKQLFHESDTDGTGTIELDEFVEHLKNDRVAAYLAALKIDTTHLADLFMEIDADGSGTIDMDEFVENMQHVMGASGLDQNVQRLLMENKEAGERWRHFVGDIMEEFSAINNLILSMPDQTRQNNNVALEGGSTAKAEQRVVGLIEDVLHKLERTPSVTFHAQPHANCSAKSLHWWV